MTNTADIENNFQYFLLLTAVETILFFNVKFTATCVVNQLQIIMLLENLLVLVATVDVSEI